MKPLSEATACVIDSGLFTELGVRLSREFGRILSHVPWRAEFPVIGDRWVGRGLRDIQWVEDPYLPEIRRQVDLFVFPDIFFAGEQCLLEESGMPVWGSHTGDALETQRIEFREFQKSLNMPLPEYEVISGYRALCEYLAEHSHCFVKSTSKIRGSMETHEFWSLDQDAYWLDKLKLDLGGAREHVRFLVEEPVESKWESGIDTYCVNGKYPKTPMQGIEVKGKLILCSAQLKSRTPTRMDKDLSLLAPELARHRYCNFLSAEYRGDILTDFCARAPNPGIGVEMEMIRNLGEIIYHGAHGELVEPDFEFEYGIQAAIFHEHDEAMWKQFPLSNDIRRWVKLMEFAYIDGLYQIIPRPPHGQKIGWLLGVGHTIDEAAGHLYKNADALTEYPFEIKVDALQDAVQQALQMEKEGLDFSDEPIPAPEKVVEGK